MEHSEPSQSPDQEPPLALPGSLGSGLQALRAIVRRVWGHSELRPLQAEAMLAGLEGRDALVVLATGGGKSLCYQAPALLREGLTVVISPLISLMADQVGGLAQNGVRAAMLTSAQPPSELRALHQEIARGLHKLVYVAPERIVLDGFLDELCSRGLANLVIDEAHCISHWGHDFRPEYRQIGLLRQRHPELSVQAFTATATPEVRRDIVAQLGLCEPLLLVGSCDRPNLTYRFHPRDELLEQCMGVIRRYPEQAGIVYCLRRRDVDDLCAKLVARGVRAAPYHAGLTPEQRKRAQQRFQSEELDVVVATVAFGMGIDRADVRYVVHASLPKGIEQYSQESGRAGRDGLPAECVMFFAGADYHGWRSLMEKSAAENGGNQDLPAALERLSRMYAFASGAQCRHRFLVEHFGERLETREGGCGACDVCLGELVALDGSEVLAQKILSCVVRCQQRFGAVHITDVLRGADTARIRQAGHGQLSTFGLLKDKSAREIRHLIDQLLGLDHLRVSEGEYPTLYLSPSGVEVMRALRSLTLYALPTAQRSLRGRRSWAAVAAEVSIAADAGLGGKAALGAAPGASAAVDEQLFEALRSLRRQLAAARGVPPYLIFNDRTLGELAVRRPRTALQLLECKGIGERKAADLGPEILAVIAASHAGA